MFKEPYYQRELEKLSLAGLTVKFFSGKQDTNHLSINDKSIDDIIEMLKLIKKELKRIKK